VSNLKRKKTNSELYNKLYWFIVIIIITKTLLLETKMATTTLPPSPAMVRPHHHPSAETSWHEHPLSFDIVAFHEKTQQAPFCSGSFIGMHHLLNAKRI